MKNDLSSLTVCLVTAGCSFTRGSATKSCDCNSLQYRRLCGYEQQKYSPDLGIVSRQLPSWMKEREGAGASYVSGNPLQGHASLNTKTKYTLCSPIKITSWNENVKGSTRSSVSQKEMVVFPFMGCDPKATRYYDTNPQRCKQ